MAQGIADGKETFINCRHNLGWILLVLRGRDMIDFANILSQLNRRLWTSDTGLPAWQSKVIGAGQIVYAVVRDLLEGQLSLRAMSLVYTTILSLVPLLAVSFSVLKGFGAHNRIEPMLLDLLAPLGERGIEITNRIIEFVENVKVAVLGSVGVALLFYTVFSLVQKIENAFNFSWRVKETRSMGQRFTGYFSVIMIGPVLVLASLGITASIESAAIVEQLSRIEPFGTLIKTASRIIPYLLVIGVFAFLYLFIPNTQVDIASAFVGALVAGGLWETVGWAFAAFVADAPNYMAIYSAFATLIVFMIWLYLSWLILLVGCGIAFYHQHPECRVSGREATHLSNRLRERTALHILVLIGRRQYQGAAHWSVPELAKSLKVPVDQVQTVIAVLQAGGLIEQTSASPVTYLPSLPLEQMTIRRVIDTVRGGDTELSIAIAGDAVVDGVMRDIDQATAEALADRSVRDLVFSETGEVAVLTSTATGSDGGPV